LFYFSWGKNPKRNRPRQNNNERVDGSHVGIVKEADEVRLGGLLQRRESRAPEAQRSVKRLRNFAYKARERRAGDQQIAAALELADLPQRHRTRLETVLLFHAALKTTNPKKSIFLLKKITCRVKKQNTTHSRSNLGAKQAEENTLTHETWAWPTNRLRGILPGSL
jgi:hypothetical protein